MIGGIFIIRENYVEVSTPVIMNRKLWETSGHWEHYKNNMYSTVIDEKGEKQDNDTPCLFLVNWIAVMKKLVI